MERKDDLHPRIDEQTLLKSQLIKKPRPKPFASFLTVMEDPNLFGEWFTPKETWEVWRVFLKAVFNEPMTESEKEIYYKHTKRRTLPKDLSEIYLVVGRRAGKSYVLASLAVYFACFYDWTPYLSRGEKGSIFITAADRDQAKIIFNYISAYLKGIPFLSNMLVRSTSEQFELNNDVNIEVKTASFRTLRGYTILATLLDEIAFWRVENSVNPDYEIVAAVRPAMATIPGSLLIASSSPYSKKGVLWTEYDKYFGVERDDKLIWKAASWEMNPTLNMKYIKEQYEKDPVTAAREWGAEFQETFAGRLVDPQLVENCIDKNVFSRPPQKDISYVGFVDPSGGSSDSFTLAIAHREGNNRVLDLVLETEPPFNPDQIVKEYSETLKMYGIREVFGDRYAGEWVSTKFEENGIAYLITQKSKSQIYLELLPMINSASVRFLDHEKMIDQLLRLERRVARNNRDVVDHPPGGHDDVINAAAGALVSIEDFLPLEVW